MNIIEKLVKNSYYGVCWAKNHKNIKIEKEEITLPDDFEITGFYCSNNSITPLLGITDIDSEEVIFVISGREKSKNKEPKNLNQMGLPLFFDLKKIKNRDAIFNKDFFDLVVGHLNESKRFRDHFEEFKQLFSNEETRLLLEVL